MRNETRTVRVGERIADVDLAHESFDEKPAGDLIAQADRIARFREMSEGIARGETWEATTDGGWPRVGWGKVIDVGMYDGWPYWTPMPSFLLSSHLGGGWHCWRMLSEARRAAA